MTDRRIAGAISAALLLLTAACGGGSSLMFQTTVPASTERFDFALLKGKAIEVALEGDGDRKELLRVVGATVLLGGSDYTWPFSQCALNGTVLGRRMAVLFTVDQPKTDVKIPCETSDHVSGGTVYKEPPAEVRYSSTAGLQGNTLDLSGELHEYHSGTNETAQFMVTADFTERFHAKFRLSADKCQVLEFNWVGTGQSTHSKGVPGTLRRTESATGCALVTPP